MSYMDTNVHFSEFLKRNRDERGMSQAQFSEIVGVPLNTYKSYELMKREPSFSVVVSICEKLGCEVSEITSPNKKEKNPLNLQDTFRALADHTRLVQLIAQFPKDHMYIQDAITVLETGLGFMEEDAQKEQSKKA